MMNQRSLGLMPTHLVSAWRAIPIRTRCATWMSHTWPRRIGSTQAPDWERRARLAYMDIAADSAQSKGTVLLVHGKNFFGAYWSGVIEALRHKGFRVIVPDLIGWGKSTKPSTLTAASLVTHLRSLVDQLKVDSFVFVGHSTGGLVGMHMARALPDRVHTLVLENPMGLEDYRVGLMRQVRHQDWAQDERSMTDDQIRQYMAHYFVNKEPRFIEPFVAVRMAVGRGPEFERWVQSAAAAYDMLLNEPAVDFVASLPTPTLFVWACPTAPMWARNTLRPKIKGPREISRRWPSSSRPRWPMRVLWVYPTPATYRIWSHQSRSVRHCWNFYVNRGPKKNAKSASKISRAIHRFEIRELGYFLRVVG